MGTEFIPLNNEKQTPRLCKDRGGIPSFTAFDSNVLQEHDGNGDNKIWQSLVGGLGVISMVNGSDNQFSHRQGQVSRWAATTATSASVTSLQHLSHCSWQAAGANKKLARILWHGTKHLGAQLVRWMGLILMTIDSVLPQETNKTHHPTPIPPCCFALLEASILSLVPWQTRAVVWHTQGNISCSFAKKTKGMPPQTGALWRTRSAKTSWFIAVFQQCSKLVHFFNVVFPASSMHNSGAHPHHWSICCLLWWWKQAAWTMPCIRHVAAWVRTDLFWSCGMKQRHKGTKAQGFTVHRPSRKIKLKSLFRAPTTTLRSFWLWAQSAHREKRKLHFM